MPLTVGSQLGPHQILGRLGTGGMGEVYRARDTKLHRDVAIKTLLLTADDAPERLARFSREAQLLASLNHPHIAQIFDLEESAAAGGPFLVMELVEGATLAERITAGPLPVEEALSIATQIADALDAAHTQGVIHRDLKPGNVKVRPDGTVKVLDFGLAKFAEVTGGAAGRDLSHSPTITTPAMTAAGVILGTAAYMSPEQARGRSVDERADVWAFGCVLYEMLAGRRAFPGDDITETLANVLKTAPDWTALPATTPPGIRRLLRRCLEKDPHERQRSIGDARLEILDAIRHPEVAPTPAEVAVPSSSARAGRARLWLQAGVLAVVAAIAATASWRVARRQSGVAPVSAVTRLAIAPSAADAITLSGSSRDLAISPDGRRVAYVGGKGTALMIRELDRDEAVRIDVGGLPHAPFFSPDGRWVGFADGLNALRRVPIGGGAIETICRVTQPGIHASWGGDSIVFTMYNALFRVPATGGVPERIGPASGETVAGPPAFLPGGNAVLFAKMGKEQGIAVLDLKSGTTKTLIPGGSFINFSPRYLSSGHVIYAAAAGGTSQSTATLRIVGFDLARLETVGTPVALNEPIFISAFGAYPDYDVSNDGTLVYVAVSARPTARRLVWVARDGSETPIDLPVRAYTYPNIAPAGTHVAFDIRDQENDTWIWDVARNTLRRLTFDRGFNQYAVWTRDGRRLVHVIGGRLVSQHADGRGSPETLAKRAHLLAPYGFSPDDRRLVFREDFPETGHDLMVLSLDRDRKVEPLLQTRFNELNAEISPDGRWLAYESDEASGREIFVRPFPDVNAGRWQISTGGGRMPLWARNGRELFFLATGGALMSAAVETLDTFASRAPARLFEHRNYIGGASSIGRTYDVSPDGNRFLMIKPDGPPANIIAVLNWHEELKRLVPTSQQ